MNLGKQTDKESEESNVLRRRVPNNSKCSQGKRSAAHF